MNSRSSFISINEATELLGVSRATIDRWRQTKQLPFIKIGKEVLFDPIELNHWMKSFHHINVTPHVSKYQSNHEPIELKIGYQTTSAQLWSPLVMKEQHLFEEQLKLRYPNTSFNIQWINAPNGMELIELLISGRIHIASVGDYPITASWQLSQLLPHFNPVLLAFDGKTTNHNGMSLVVPRQSNIHDLDKLNEYSISAVSGSSSAYRLSQWKSEHQNEAEMIVHRNMENCLQDIMNKQTAASMLWEPYLSWAELSGAGVTIPSQLSHENYLTGVIANEEWVVQHEEMVICYLQAHIKAHQLMREQHELAVKIIHQSSGFPSQVVAQSLTKIHWDAAVYEQDIDNLANITQNLAPKVTLQQSNNTMRIETQYLGEAIRSLKLPILSSNQLQGSWSSDYLY